MSNAFKKVAVMAVCVAAPIGFGLATATAASAGTVSCTDSTIECVTWQVPGVNPPYVTYPQTFVGTGNVVPSCTKDGTTEFQVDPYWHRNDADQAAINAVTADGKLDKDEDKGIQAGKPWLYTPPKCQTPITTPLVGTISDCPDVYVDIDGAVPGDSYSVRDPKTSFHNTVPVMADAKGHVHIDLGQLSDTPYKPGDTVTMDIYDETAGSTVGSASGTLKSCDSSSPSNTPTGSPSHTPSKTPTPVHSTGSSNPAQPSHAGTSTGTSTNVVVAQPSGSPQVSSNPQGPGYSGASDVGVAAKHSGFSPLKGGIVGSCALALLGTAFVASRRRNGAEA